MACRRGLVECTAAVDRHICNGNGTTEHGQARVGAECKEVGVRGWLPVVAGLLGSAAGSDSDFLCTPRQETCMPPARRLVSVSRAFLKGEIPKDKPASAPRNLLVCAEALIVATQQ